MQFTFRQLRKADISEIATWHYDGPYALYDGRTLRTSLFLWLFLRPLFTSLGYEFFSVDDEQGKLIGLFQFSSTPRRTVTIGLGLRPNFTGHGNGLAFVEAGLSFGKQRYAPRAFRLLVAAFNQRATKVYTRAGFNIIRELQRSTIHGREKFYEMKKDM
jgi:ribosomal-protein-alanine N-acetyltransferase